MNTDITYDQLKPHLTKENRLWVEDNATLHIGVHEGIALAWKRLFDEPWMTALADAYVEVEDPETLSIYPQGRVVRDTPGGHEIYQIPEAAMRELGLPVLTASDVADLQEEIGRASRTVGMSPALGAPYGASDDHKTHVEAILTATEELQEASGEVPRHPCPATVSGFIDVADLLPVSPLRNACYALTESLNFFTWPAAITFHHNREGGLIEHTLEVVDIALHIAAKFPGVNTDVLIAAALWHDYGKLFEYLHTDSLSEGIRDGQSILVQRVDASGITHGWFRDRKAVHHCISSAQEFIVAARQHGVDRATEDAVVHCILSHHGPVKEWGSPVAPESLEAIILHQADYLSAKAGATK